MRTKPSRLLFYTICVIASFVTIIISCNKKFDAPPMYIPPNITANTTIATLKAMHVSGQVDSITTDMIIQGTVTANDSSGNFYKQIVIQDSTGGIAVSIDDYNLYATFPIGRQVYVKLKGLFMAENTGLIYVGGSPDNGGAVAGIASRLKDLYLIKGEINHPVTPTVVSISDLKNNSPKYMYMLVQFQNFEVKGGDTAKTYAYSTATSKTDANIVVKGCSSSDTMIIRSSGYSYFANVYVPKGNGTLTAIYAYYKSPYNSKVTPQVIIRDTSDVQFTGSRCDGTTPPPPTNATLKTIGEIRALYKGSDVKIDSSYKIGGVVISDIANGNVGKGNVILQDGDAGIAVYFGNMALTYKLGDSLVVDITGKTVKKFNGSLEIDAYGDTPPAAVATNKAVTPKEITIANLNNTISTIEYTLVKIKSATASGQATFYADKSNATLKDVSGNIELYTSSFASFASTALPSGAKDWIGYANTYTNSSNTSYKEFQIRNLNDISDASGGGIDTTGGTDTTGGGVDTTVTPPPTGSDLIISEYAEGSSNNKYLEIYNAGSVAADLSKYALKLYANGGTSITNQATLDTLYSSATLAPGGIIVIQQPSAALPLPAGITAHSSSVCNFNGNDAITLEKNGAVIDVFGAVGDNPSTGGWKIAGTDNASVDHAVRRKASVTQGNTNWTNSSANEWTVGAKDDVSGLGTR